MTKFSISTVSSWSSPTALQVEFTFMHQTRLIWPCSPPRCIPVVVGRPQVLIHLTRPNPSKGVDTCPSRCRCHEGVVRRRENLKWRGMLKWRGISGANLAGLNIGHDRIGKSLEKFEVAAPSSRYPDEKTQMRKQKILWGYWLKPGPQNHRSRAIAKGIWPTLRTLLTLWGTLSVFTGNPDWT